MSHDAPLMAAVDQLLAETYSQDEPGAAAIVVKDGQVVFRKAYGMAHLELGVPMQPEYIFRIGSITKQFTAVAVLMLVQEGKVALDDELTRFLPDYPTQGHRITVEHLLTHTSGIKSYTSLPDFWKSGRQDRSLAELIDVFKQEPMEFAPSERYTYNNSGYVLLGAIIEVAAGQSYDAFIRQRICEPLGLRHTDYDHTEQIVSGRAAGYERTPDGIRNAPFLSMTLPQAAGGLISSVDDLARWDAALYTERLVSRALLERAWTPYRLGDGQAIGYGYGWNLGSYEGHPVVRHSGGIPGFITTALRLPDDRVFVAILTNSTGKQPEPGYLAMKIGAHVIGRPHTEPVPILLDPATLDRYAGVYRARPGEERTILREDDKLFLQWHEGAKQEILPLAEDEFFIPNDASFTRLQFVGNRGEPPTSLEIRGIGPSETAHRIQSNPS